MESTAAQQKIAGLQNLVSGGKFSLDGISSWLKKADTAADYNASLGLGPVPEAVASGTPEYVAGRVARPERGMLSKLHTRVGAAGRQLGKVTGLGGKIGPHALGYGAAGLGAAGLYGLYRLLAGGGEPEEKKVASNERLGTPFTDGFLSFCIKHKLDGEKVAEMIEKGAALEGKTGQECKGFLDRVLSK
jgi:hypothetical protein